MIQLVGLCVAMIVLLLFSMQSGTIEVTLIELFQGLFVEYNDKVSIIYDLRFPRIIISIFAGASFAVSGLLLQTSLKNPLADPTIIGIAGGANFVAVLVSTLAPTLFFYIPLFSSIGGMIAYLLIYSLAYKQGADTTRIILVGIAISAVFTGFIQLLSSMSSQVLLSSLSQLVWRDVRLVVTYSVIGLLCAIFLINACNVMRLNDDTLSGVGIPIHRLRMGVSFVAVFLCAGVTSTVGIISFLSLIAPHMARKLVGNDYKILVPFTMVLGGFILLLTDTAGRLLFSPFEVDASILMSIIGGPYFIYLLRKGVKI